MILMFTTFGCKGQKEDSIKIKVKKMDTTKNNYGIEGLKAPEWKIEQWVDENGNKTKPIQLSDYKGKFKVIYCFQSWCPGCHSIGLPSLQVMTDALKDNDNVKYIEFGVWGFTLPSHATEGRFLLSKTWLAS